MKCKHRESLKARSMRMIEDKYIIWVELPGKQLSTVA